MDGQNKVADACAEVLKRNDLGAWTRPAPNLYPHQWLWDSCFIAIGLRHVDIGRAQKEVKSLFRGQWKNGMIPNIIYGSGKKTTDDIWNSRSSRQAPHNIRTSGITQPPMIAEAVVKIGEKMTKKARHQWYSSVFDDLVAYHEWLYRERDPHNEGLVVLVHPWECGLDNNPGWMSEMHFNHLPLWIHIVRSLKLQHVIALLRRDSGIWKSHERIDTIDALGLFSIARRLRRKKYETRLIFRRSHLAVEDLAFNSILVRANTLLHEISQELNRELPGWLHERMKKAPHALELLWHETRAQYFSRNFVTFEPINESSIMTFMPLYAGTITKARAANLVELLHAQQWHTTYPVPSVPKSSPYFQPKRYWQGPTWINTNWLIADGLERYGYHAEAEHIRQRSIELVEKHGSYEYFSPLDGSPAGTNNFSWTAALTIDFLNQ
jgi:hypothetical protein